MTIEEGAQASDGSTFLSTGNANPVDGLVGYHVYGSESNNRGFSLDWQTTGVPGWSLGLDTTYGDCYLFNYGAGTYQFRLRGDTGQLELGPNVPHPQRLRVALGYPFGVSVPNSPSASRFRPAVKNSVFGPAPGVEGFYLANGFSGHGFQHAPVVGKLLTEMVVEGRAGKGN